MYRRVEAARKRVVGGHEQQGRRAPDDRQQGQARPTLPSRAHAQQQKRNAQTSSDSPPGVMPLSSLPPHHIEEDASDCRRRVAAASLSGYRTTSNRALAEGSGEG